jgi:hypothetical protein
MSYHKTNSQIGIPSSIVNVVIWYSNHGTLIALWCSLVVHVIFKFIRTGDVVRLLESADLVELRVLGRAHDLEQQALCGGHAHAGQGGHAPQRYGAVVGPAGAAAEHKHQHIIDIDMNINTKQDQHQH